MFASLSASAWLIALLCSIAVRADGLQYSEIDKIFEGIKPSSELKWRPCADIYRCSRLLLPLDTNKPSLGNVAIALILLPGTHGTHPSNYTASPLLVNPGGPGGSGIEFMFRRGKQLRTILGPEQDILSFDPRGIAHSTPLLDCFAAPEDGESELSSSVVRREIWKATRYHVDPKNVDDEISLRTVYQRNSGMSQLCNLRDRELGEASIFKFATAPYVAQDMLGIQDVWTRWRLNVSSSSAIPPDSVADIDFWGFSYGSLLGATFAAMFPSRVGKVIIDGIVDSKKWFYGQLLNDYVDSEKVVTKFAEYCAAAGERCGFYQQDNTASDVETRLNRVLNDLLEMPVAVVDSIRRMPALITHDDIKNQLFESLYKPMQLFPSIAKSLAALESQNLTRIGEVVQLPTFGGIDNSTELSYRQLHTLMTAGDNEANTAVLCGDQEGRQKLNLKHVRHILHDSRRFTNFTNEVLRDIFGCIGWDIKPKKQLPKALTSDTDGEDFEAVKTKHPILIMSTTLDPICPLSGAVAMVPRFLNASLIEVLAEGHCSVSRVSLCAARAVRRFFAEGEMPETDVKNGKWLRCEGDETPWFPYDGNAVATKPGGQVVMAKGSADAWRRDHSDVASLAEAWSGLGENILPLVRR